MRLFIKYLFLLIGHVIVCNSKAQDLNFTFKHFGTEEGMPSNTVYCATEDKNGYMWFGTDAGVCRFDGNER
jgi:ligand-binding sensor domain-containing protein